MRACKWALTGVDTKVIKEVVPLAEDAVGGVFLGEAGLIVALQDSYLSTRCRVDIGVDAVLIGLGDMLFNAETLQVKVSPLCYANLMRSWNRIEKLAIVPNMLCCCLNLPLVVRTYS